MNMMRNQKAGANGDGAAEPSCFPLNSLSPEEITLAATVFAIALSEAMPLDDASLLAFFLSTVSSNMGIFLEKKRRDLEQQEAEPPFPDVL